MAGPKTILSFDKQLSLKVMKASLCARMTKLWWYEITNNDETKQITKDKDIYHDS